MGKKLKATVIGCGRIGSEFDDDPKRDYVATHSGAYKSVKDCDLVAVCDSDPGKLSACLKNRGVDKGYEKLEDMLRSEEIDMASICTPPGTHYPVIRELVKSPGVKAIFCEKPLSDNIRDAKKIVDLCREKGVILQVDHQRRFDPLHHELKDAITSGRFGGVQQVNFYYTAGIRNTGSHMFDLLRFFFGDVEWVKAFPSKNPSHNESDPNVDGMMRFSSGIMATFQACDVKKYLMFELNCFLEKARFILKDSGFSLELYKAGESPNFTGYKELFKTKSPYRTSYKRDFMVNAVRHLVDCVRSKDDPVSSGEDGLAALCLIEAALRSADNGGRKVKVVKEG